MFLNWTIHDDGRRRLRSLSALPDESLGCRCQNDGDLDGLEQGIADLPIRYRARTYGSTNIRRWSHGGLLLRMVIFAARRIKFT